MECYCSSKTLYSTFNENYFINLHSVGGAPKKAISSKRSSLKNLNDPLKSKFIPLFEHAFEICSINFPPFIQKVDFLDIMANPLKFHQEFVSKNVPCIIINAIDSWNALDLWSSPEHFCEKLAGQQITVDLTPDGFADSIKNCYFIEPFQETMTIKDFFHLEEDSKNSVGYIQKQNDNLNSEFSNLLVDDIDLSLREYFSKKIFGKPVDVCNFWMGKNSSVSSLHKDHYENIYAVIQGEKHFTLIPPVCYPSLYEGKYYRNRWLYDKEKKEYLINENSNTMDITNWITVNPDNENDLKDFPALGNENIFKKYHVVVNAGEILYLPSLWFHQVSQYQKNKDWYTAAVNFWFDMDFGTNFALLETMASLKNMEI